MKEFMHINHIDEILAMDKKMQMELRLKVKKHLLENPSLHLSTEWGILADVDLNNVESFIDNLLSEMTLEQKINQMSGDYLPAIGQFVFDRYNYEPYFAGEDISLNIPAIKFSDGPSGVVLGYSSTAFPVSMARAATFDTELEEKVGNAIGIEARSLGANFFGGVCINLLRHPGWGRAQETYGEDPYLLGTMGSSLIKGVQNHMMACVKHFAANSIENSRFKVNVKMDERTLREVYLPHFKMCIDNGVAAVMSAYNQVLGKWCGHNSYLLTDILKKEWGFSGFVMSDFSFGIRNTIEAANAGLDVEMNITQYYGDLLVEAVKDGDVAEEKINESVKRILTQKIRFAQISDSSIYSKNKVACKKHRNLALEVARKSAVLLKNDNLLPLDRNKTKRIMVAGKFAKEGCLGDVKGSSAVFPPYVISALDGIMKASREDVEVDYTSATVFDIVRKKGSNYDAVIVYVGLNEMDEGEYFPLSSEDSIGGDRISLSLKPNDLELIQAAYEGNENTIVVLQGGSAIEVEPWCNKVKAIIMQWYSGMEGGTALGEIIYGDINPSGKLPITFYKNAQQLPYFGLDIDSIEYEYYHGYFAVDQYKQQISYPFGFGLSYTTFYFGEPKLSSSSITKDSSIFVSVEIKNIGDVEGATVLQLYIGALNSRVERHKKDLKAYKRVNLKPSESKIISLPIEASSLAYYSTEISQWEIESCKYRVFVGSSSSEKDLKVIDFEVL
ncbi:MAG: beta-glucosidase family protein [Pleomorphochaeta sp.]